MQILGQRRKVHPASKLVKRQTPLSTPPICPAKSRCQHQSVCTWERVDAAAFRAVFPFSAGQPPTFSTPLAEKLRLPLTIIILAPALNLLDRHPGDDGAFANHRVLELWQRHEKVRPFAGRALDRDASAVGLDDGLTDTQS